MNEQVMPTIDGIPFRCDCGCNVFTKIGEYQYRCNACRVEYQGEPKEKTKLKITTLSGAVYYIEDDVVTGGSLELTDGRLVLPAQVGLCLYILTPERAEQNPTAKVPGVGSTPVVSIEVIDEFDDTKRA